MKCNLLIFVSCVAYLIANIAYGTVPIPPIDAVSRALARGDRYGVHQAEKKEHVGPITRSMDCAQLNYDIKHLILEVKKCQYGSQKNKSVGYLLDTLYCSYIFRSAALIQGDARVYIREIRWSKNKLFPALAHAVHHKFQFGNGLDTTDLNGLVSSAPRMEETWIAKSSTLPFQRHANALERHRVPAILVKVNSQQITAFALLNRVVLRTPVMVIDPVSNERSFAARLKLKKLVGDYVNSSIEIGPVKYQVKPNLYLADKVVIGPLVLRHVAVGVIRTDVLAPGVYLGQSMWRRFGEVSVSNHGISLRRRPVADCASPVPLTFAAGDHLFGSLIFPVRLNDRPRKAAFFFARSQTLSADATALADSGHAAASAPDRPGTKVKGPFTVRVGDQHIQVPSVYVTAKSNNPYQISLGGPLLNEYTVHLKLRGGDPTICFVPNVDKSNGHAL